MISKFETQNRESNMTDWIYKKRISYETWYLEAFWLAGSEYDIEISKFKMADQNGERS